MTRQSRVKGWVEVPAARAHLACARAPHPSRRLLEPGGGGAGEGTNCGGVGGGRLRALPATAAIGSAAPASRRGPGQERVGGSIRFEDSEKNEVARDRLKEVAVTQTILDNTIEFILCTT